jgi:hypothetical protein
MAKAVVVRKTSGNYWLVGIFSEGLNGVSLRYGDIF